MNPNNQGKFKKFDDEDLDNKNIDLNTIQTGQSQVKPLRSNYTDNFLKNPAIKKEDLAVAMIMKNTNVTEEVSNSVINKINSNLQFVGKHFNVEVDDIQQKLISSVLPMNKKFYQLAEASPDLYGPFWIFTTLVFLVTFAGNVSNYLSLRIKNIY